MGPARSGLCSRPVPLRSTFASARGKRPRATSTTMPDPLAPLGTALWLWVAAPLLAVTALVLTVRLKAPQLTRLAAGLRTVRHPDPDAPGSVAPGLATVLAAVGSFGAAAAVGSATAISLGGAGAVAWVWLFGFLIAPLRFAETLLARTDVPGRPSPSAPGSLATRLGREASPALRTAGAALSVLVACAAFAFVGGIHGGAVVDAAGRLLPRSGPWLVAGVAVVAAILVVGGVKRSASIAGWLGVSGLLAILCAALWAAAHNPERAFGTLTRAIGEAIDGSPTAGPFTGALAGEVAFAAVLHALPPLAAPTGAVGALHALGRARTTRGQAAAALLGPFAYAIVVTALGMAFVATGAYFERAPAARPITELRVVRGQWASASERLEKNRLWTGYMRIVKGKARDLSLDVASERGMVDSPTFTYFGKPADIAMQFRDGVPFRLLRQRTRGALADVSPAELAHVVVHGRMLPMGAGGLTVAMARGTGAGLGGRLALAALLLLAAVAAAGWGFAAAASAGPAASPVARLALALLPAAGIGVAASGVAPWLGSAGLIAGALLSTVTCLVLLARSGVVAKLG